MPRLLVALDYSPARLVTVTSPDLPGWERSVRGVVALGTAVNDALIERLRRDDYRRRTGAAHPRDLTDPEGPAPRRNPARRRRPYPTLTPAQQDERRARLANARARRWARDHPDERTHDEA